jgi:hypothetical protein
LLISSIFQTHLIDTQGIDNHIKSSIFKDMKNIRLDADGRFLVKGEHPDNQVEKVRAARVAKASRVMSASSKDRRQAFFINKSKKSSSIKAVNDARLIRDFKPSDVSFIKICA